MNWYPWRHRSQDARTSRYLLRADQGVAPDDLHIGCQSQRKGKGKQRTRWNDSVALFGPGLISRRWHGGVVSEIARCFGSLPKAHTILHLSLEPDIFLLPSWRGAGARIAKLCPQVGARATGARAKAKAALNKLINYARSERGEDGRILRLR